MGCFPDYASSCVRSSCTTNIDILFLIGKISSFSTLYEDLQSFLLLFADTLIKRVIASTLHHMHKKLVTYAHFTRSGLNDIIRMILTLEGLLASGNTMREKFFKKL